MKKIACLAVFFGLCVLVVSVGAAEMRTWMSNNGKFTTEAELVEVSKDGLFVTLRKKDGKESLVAMERLSEEDKEYIAQQKPAKKAEPAQTVPPTDKPSRIVATHKNGYSPEVIAKQIDVLNVKDDGKLRCELSDDEKEIIIDFLTLYQNKAGGKYVANDEFWQKTFLENLLERLYSIKVLAGTAGSRGQYAIEELGILLSEKVKKVDIYLVGIAAYKAVDYVRVYSTNQYNRDTEGKANERRLAIIENLLPECNKLTGNAHDGDENERAAKKQRGTDKGNLF